VTWATPACAWIQNVYLSGSEQVERQGVRLLTVDHQADPKDAGLRPSRQLKTNLILFPPQVTSLHRDVVDRHGNMRGLVPFGVAVRAQAVPEDLDRGVGATDHR
jgi:hypothetical protein